jgi:hypothetical protein
MFGRLKIFVSALAFAAASLAPAAAADGPSAFYDSNFNCAIAIATPGQEFTLQLNAAYTKHEKPELSDFTAIVTVGLDEYDVEEQHLEKLRWSPQFEIKVRYPLSAGQALEIELVAQGPGGKRFEVEYRVRVENKTRQGRMTCGLD